MSRYTDTALPTPGDSSTADTWGTRLNTYFGYLATIAQSTHNVKDYGAAADGTDDATAIQDAIDAASAAGGGVVFFPAGSYSIATALSLPTGVTLQGTGRGVTWIQVTDDIDGIDITAAAYRWAIKDLGVRVADAAGGDASTSAGIVIGAGCYQFRLENVLVDDSPINGYEHQDGIRATGAWTGVFANVETQSLARYGLYVAGGDGGFQNVHFSGCDFEQASGTACVYFLGTACDFSACAFQGDPLGLDLRGDRNTFTGCWWENGNYGTSRCINLSGGASNNLWLAGSMSAGSESGSDHMNFEANCCYNTVIGTRLSAGDTTKITIASTAFDNLFIDTPLEDSEISASASCRYSLFAGGSTTRRVRWFWDSAGGQWTLCEDTSTGIMIRARVDATALAASSLAGIYTTQGGGSDPFDAYGNAILKAYTIAASKALIYTGSPSAKRAEFDESGIDFFHNVNVPAGYEYQVGGVEVSATRTIAVDLTSAEIKALRATPKELVAAPGAAKLLEFVSAILVLDYGDSNVFSESDDNLAVEYDGGSGAQASETIETTGFIDQSGDTITTAVAKADAIDAYADVVNKNLALANIGAGEIGGNAAGDNALRVLVTYRLHTVLGVPSSSPSSSISASPSSSAS